MKEKLFWEMYDNGELAQLAKRDRFEFNNLVSETIDETIDSSTQKLQPPEQISFKKYAGKFYEKLYSATKIKIEEVKTEADRNLYILQHLHLIKVLFLVTSDRDEPSIKRLEGLQWKIDMLRKKHKKPLGACIEISKLMMGYLEKPNAVLNQKYVSPNIYNADLIPFRGKEFLDWDDT